MEEAQEITMNNQTERKQQKRCRCGSIKDNTHFQYVLNMNMEIPTTHEILLLRLMLCAIVLFFGAMYAITLFIDSFFLCQTYAVTLLEIFLFETGKESSWGHCTADCHFFSAEFVAFVVLCLSFFWCSCLEATLCTTIAMTVKNVFEGNLTCLNQLFNCFYLLFFILHPQSFFTRRASALVHPHWWALLSLTMENMCLATTFTRWEGFARNDGSEISS